MTPSAVPATSTLTIVGSGHGSVGVAAAVKGLIQNSLGSLSYGKILRWDIVLAKYDSEKPLMRQAIRNAPSVKQQAQQAKQEGQQRINRMS
ncbi:hypothetical protein ACXR2U_03145 [Jatrophihabitans sp. YIM 134969]